jgi:hypothetical protein
MTQWRGGVSGEGMQQSLSATVLPLRACPVTCIGKGELIAGRYGARNASWRNGGSTMNESQQSGAPEGFPDLRSLSTVQRVGLLVKALNGAKRTNEALARCRDGEAMLDVLLDASARLGLGLSRAELRDTPPIRDWIWWKNKEAVFTIGDAKPRYQQDGGQGRPPSPQPETLEEGTTRKKFLGLF